jgi:purine-binding chemotaxis protein CheW
MSEATLVRLLVFRVGNLVCAAEVDAVREILPRLPTTRIPGAPPVVAGLVNVRGTLVTVVEGWRALGQPEPPTQADGGGGSTVLLEVGESRRVAGFTVDEVMDMLAVGPATLEERSGGGLAGVDPTLVRAVGRRGDQLFVVLDVAALLGPIVTPQGREQ